jgi:hypothetical protein
LGTLKDPIILLFPDEPQGQQDYGMNPFFRTCVNSWELQKPSFHVKMVDYSFEWSIKLLSEIQLAQFTIMNIT